MQGLFGLNMALGIRFMRPHFGQASLSAYLPHPAVLSLIIVTINLPSESNYINPP
jgi:hypothetical protein